MFFPFLWRETHLGTVNAQGQHRATAQVAEGSSEFRELRNRVRSS